jgi:hypothetical protein
MEEDVFGYEVLVEGRVKFLQVINPAGFENPDDFPQGTLPIGHVMKDAEAEDRVQRFGFGRDPEDVGHIERNPLFHPFRKIGPASADHPDIQVHGLEHRRLKFFTDENGSRAPTASHLQNDTPRCERPPSLHPANLQPLLNGTGRVIDRPSFSPVEFHGKKVQMKV